MHTITPYEPEYCATCGEILSTEGFCMRCSGTEFEEESEGVLPMTNPLEELDFDKDQEPLYEPDTISTGQERDSIEVEFSRDGTYEMPDLYGGNFR